MKMFLVIEPTQKEIYESCEKSIISQFDKFKGSVWCRNGDVCDKARHCETLKCEYKLNKLDIKNGISKCQSFQLTDSCEDWFYAKHINNFFKFEDLNEKKLIESNL